MNHCGLSVHATFTIGSVKQFTVKTAIKSAEIFDGSTIIMTEFQSASNRRNGLPV